MSLHGGGQRVEGGALLVIVMKCSLTFAGQTHAVLTMASINR